MYGLHHRDLQARIAQQIDDFRLQDFVEDLTESYSHGMKQRLAFAAAMLHDPKVLVIDEPMVGLDPRSVRLVKDLLRVKAAAGQTIFMSTHLLSIAEEIADRVGIVDQGSEIPGHDRPPARSMSSRESPRASVPELHGRKPLAC
jgi:ABC-2 type transport system ATP-binding protein